MFCTFLIAMMVRTRQRIHVPDDIFHVITFIVEIMKLSSLPRYLASGPDSGTSSTDVVVPAIRRSSLGDRAFPVAGDRAWNALPPSNYNCNDNISNAPSTSRPTYPVVHKCLCPVSPPHHLCPHSGDYRRHFFSSDNGVNYTNYRSVVVPKCLALSTTLILAN